MNSTLQLPETGRVKLKVFRWFVLAVAGSERLRTEMTEAYSDPAQQGTAVFDCNAVAVVGSFTDEQQRASRRRFKDSCLIFKRGDGADAFLCPIQLALVNILKNRIERALFEVLLFDVWKKRAGK